jgi:hypothetical protein
MFARAATVTRQPQQNRANGAPGQSNLRIPDGVERDVQGHSHSGQAKPGVSRAVAASVMKYCFFPLNENRHAPAGYALE